VPGDLFFIFFTAADMFEESPDKCQTYGGLVKKLVHLLALLFEYISTNFNSFLASYQLALVSKRS
jgi:hypothetical protein